MGKGGRHGGGSDDHGVGGQDVCLAGKGFEMDQGDDTGVVYDVHCGQGGGGGNYVAVCVSTWAAALGEGRKGLGPGCRVSIR